MDYITGRTCKCGCGKPLTSNHPRTQYASRDCYPKTTGKRKPVEVEKTCLCGCGRKFTDRTSSQQRKFFISYPCRARYLKLINKRDPNIICKNIASWPKDAPHRKTVCQGRGVDGSKPYQCICANYSACSDGIMTGEKWEFEKNPGVDCWVDSRIALASYGNHSSVFSLGGLI